MKLAVRQKGASLIGVLLVLMCAVFVANVALKTIPHYLDFISLKKSIIIGVSDHSKGIESTDEFYTYIARNMEVNNIQGVDLKKALTVHTDGSAFTARLDYEQRVPLVFNIDLVMKFNEQFGVAKP